MAQVIQHPRAKGINTLTAAKHAYNIVSSCATQQQLVNYVDALMVCIDRAEAERFNNNQMVG